MLQLGQVTQSGDWFPSQGENEDIRQILSEAYPRSHTLDDSAQDRGGLVDRSGLRDLPYAPQERQRVAGIIPETIVQPSLTCYPHPNNPTARSGRTQLKEYAENIDQGVVMDSYTKPGVVIHERVVDQHEKIIRKKLEVVEKIVEVEHVTVKEKIIYEKKIQEQERIVKVPVVKTKEIIKEVEFPKIVEKIVEVPQIQYREKIIKIPRVEIQERIIEVPKIVYEEQIEYEDHMEYREVPVTIYVEVPVDDFIRVEVDQPHEVPMYEFVEKIQYVEVPQTQIQEVERKIEQPVITHRPVPRQRQITKEMYRLTYDDGKQTIHDNSNLPTVLDPRNGEKFKPLNYPSRPAGPCLDQIPPFIDRNIIPGIREQAEEMEKLRRQVQGRPPEPPITPAATNQNQYLLPTQQAPTGQQLDQQNTLLRQQLERQRLQQQHLQELQNQYPNYGNNFNPVHHQTIPR